MRIPARCTRDPSREASAAGPPGGSHAARSASSGCRAAVLLLQAAALPQSRAREPDSPNVPVVDRPPQRVQRQRPWAFCGFDPGPSRPQGRPRSLPCVDDRPRAWLDLERVPRPLRTTAGEDEPALLSPSAYSSRGSAWARSSPRESTPVGNRRTRRGPRAFSKGSPIAGTRWGSTSSRRLERASVVGRTTLKPRGQDDPRRRPLDVRSLQPSNENSGRCPSRARLLSQRLGVRKLSKATGEHTEAELGRLGRQRHRSPPAAFDEGMSALRPDVPWETIHIKPSSIRQSMNV